MFVASLASTAIKTVAQNLLQGNCTSGGIKLPPNVSNAVFEKIQGNESSETAALVASEILSVTRVKLHEKELKSGMVQFLSKQNHLEVFNIECIDWAVQEYDYFTENQDEKGTFEVLAECLNERSRMSLRHVGFTHFQLPEHIEDESILMFSNLFPNITSLSFTSCKLQMKRFVEICCSELPNLKQLNISFTSFHSLEGVSKLVHLEALTLNRVVFESFTGHRELCELKTLQSLDFTSGKLGEFCEAVTEYVAKGMVPLPMLRELDCTCSDITEEMFHVFRQSFPSLRQICLVDTPLNAENLQANYPNLTISNCENLQSILNSYQFYKRRGNILSQLFLLDKMIKNLSLLEYETGQDWKVRRALIQEIVETIKEQDVINWIWITGNKILYVLCPPAFYHHLTMGDVQAILDIYQPTRTEYRRPQEFWECIECHVLHWSIASAMCRCNLLAYYVGMYEHVTYSLLVDVVELLVFASNNNILNAMYKFLEHVFYNSNCLDLYETVLRALQHCLDVCPLVREKYVAERMIEPFFFNLNFDGKSSEEAWRIKKAHLTMLMRVTTHPDNVPVAALCQDSIVSHLLNYATAVPPPLDMNGLLALVSLLTILKFPGEAVSPEYRRRFELLKFLLRTMCF